MMVKFHLDGRKVPNGTVLVLGIRYEAEPDGDTRGRTNPKVYTYAALKAGGLWYLTGSGKVPTAAGWTAVQNWLARDGRVVEYVDVLGARTRLWPEPPGKPTASRPVTSPGERPRGIEWRDRVRTPGDDALGYHDL